MKHEKNKWAIFSLDNISKCNRFEQKQTDGWVKSTAEVCTCWRLLWSDQYDFLGRSTAASTKCTLPP